MTGAQASRLRIVVTILQPASETLALQSLLDLARSIERFPWFRARVLAVFQDLNAVDENIVDAHGELMRIFIRRAVSDRVGIENYHVRKHSWFEKASMIETEVGRRQTRQTTNGFCKRDYLLFTHILAEQAGAGALPPRGRPRFYEDLLRGGLCCIPPNKEP